jgi:hypothetical protein
MNTLNTRVTRAASGVTRRNARNGGQCPKDLMARLGQDSARSALIYQHASRQVDQTIADELSTLIEGMADTTTG